MTVKRIVLGLDGSDGSADACRWCADLARSLDAEVVAVHGMQLPAYPVIVYGNSLAPVTAEVGPEVIAGWRDARQALLDSDWCAPLRDAGVRHRTEIVDGHPAEVIRDVADREDAGLIIVGSRGMGGFRELLLGGVGHQLVLHAHRPVVIVPQDER